MQIFLPDRLSAIPNLKSFSRNYGLRSAGARYTSVVVLQPFDVVFSKISPPLNFNEDKDLGAGIFDAVRDSGRNIDGCTRLQNQIPTVNGYASGPGDNHPVFRSMLVFLVTKAFLGKDFDAFDLIVRSLIKHGEAAPWTFIT